MWRVGVPERAEGEHGPVPGRVVHMLESLDLDLVRIPVGAPPGKYAFDALLLTGGIDPNPRLWSRSVGREAPSARSFDDERDERELAAIELASSRGCPILGVCRGAELLTVWYGGKLQTLGSQHELESHGARLPGRERSPAVHDVFLAPDSELSRRLNTVLLRGCSSSHSLVPVVSATQPLTPAGFDAGGNVEAVEDRSRGVVGVMWHPEDTFLSQEVQRSVVLTALRPGGLELP